MAAPNKCARSTLCRSISVLSLALILVCALAGLGWAQANLRDVDEELQDLRSKLLELNSDLDALEQDLLTPRTSSVKVFLTSNAGKNFDLQSVKVLLNDKMVGTHVYRAEENMALQNGGAQSLFEGRIPPGDHTILAQFGGVDRLDNRVQEVLRIKFKGKERTMTFIELRVVYSQQTNRPDFVYEIYE